MTNKFSELFLRNASTLDKSLCQDGELYQYAMLIVEKKDASAIIYFCEHLREYGKNPKLSQLCKDTYDSLVYSVGFSTITEICKNKIDFVMEDTKTLDELLGELNNLIGLASVKRIVYDLVAYQKVQSLRERNGLKTPKRTLHLAFTGNPGTGKTTVARIVGRLYKQLGILSRGHFVEVSRTDLIAGYQGQTALKVKNVIDRAKGGVLFIDEAYSLTENDHSDSYGRECLTELTKALEDFREDLVVIVAGYTEPMKIFFESNPGLRSRFNTFVEFPDFSDEELMQILALYCDNDNYCLPQCVTDRLHEFILNAREKYGNNFSNGRFVRNVYEGMIINHAHRVCSIENPTIDELQQLDLVDIPFEL